ncbi:hypothetical protein SKAU_G00407800 [Synaphobranchus kaupii]|uniref:Uncharacterized protein n=1 Tax=Synaphobranchus kaupii TaxID=118154 RepID=A0A9Q1EAD2_SYNKA|nr:hypothetical protein SKAU_G00407800 [Synaphobranchus kaupii]
MGGGQQELIRGREDKGLLARGPNPTVPCGGERKLTKEDNARQKESPTCQSCFRLHCTSGVQKSPVYQTPQTSSSHPKDLEHLTSALRRSV